MVTSLGDVSVVRVPLVRTVMLVLLDPLELLYVSPEEMLSDSFTTVVSCDNFSPFLLCRDLLERRESRDLLDLQDSRYLFRDWQCSHPYLAAIFISNSCPPPCFPLQGLPGPQGATGETGKPGEQVRLQSRQNHVQT